jgi:hypothetical protein
MADSSTVSDRLMGLHEFQTFGPDGPMYQVLGPGRDAAHVRVRVMDTDEEFDYRLADARQDPPA